MKAKTTKETTTKEMAANFDSLDILPGQVRRRVGDVIVFSRDKYVIESVSPSRAVARCMARQKHMIKDSMTGEEIEANATPSYISISSCCDKADVIDHIVGYQMPVTAISKSAS